MPVQVAPAPIEAPTVTLLPGVSIEGKVVKTATVRLLIRRDYREAAAETPEAREDFLLARMITRLGEQTNADIIAAAVPYLTSPDEARIRAAVAELELKYADVPATEAPLYRAHDYSVSEIESEPFALNPGLKIGDQVIKSCIVRLPTRGQWRDVEREIEVHKKNDLAIYYSVAAFDDHRQFPLEWIDYLTEGDHARIDDAARRLRELYAPEPKSECPNCGHRY